MSDRRPARLLDKKPDIRAALQSHVNTELAKRVRDAVLR